MRSVFAVYTCSCRCVCASTGPYCCSISNSNNSSGRRGRGSVESEQVLVHGTGVLSVTGAQVMVR